MFVVKATFKKKAAAFVVLSLILAAPYQAFAIGEMIRVGSARTSQAPMRINSLRISADGVALTRSLYQVADLQRPPSPAAIPVLPVPVTSDYSGANAEIIRVTPVLQPGNHSGAILSVLTQRQTELSATLGRSGVSADQVSRAAGSAIDGSANSQYRYLETDELAGKTLLLVGFRRYLPYLIQQPMKLGAQHGFSVKLIGYPHEADAAVALGVPRENFIGVDDFGTHDETTVQTIVAHVRGIHARDPFHAVKTFTNYAAFLEGKLHEALGLPGNLPRAVDLSQNKQGARVVWNEDPALRVPARIVASAEDARRFFREAQAAGFDKIVLKPSSGGGGFLAKTEIVSAKAAALVFQEMKARIDQVRGDKMRAQTKAMDLSVGVLAEAQIPDIGPGIPPIMLDVEMLVQRGKVVHATISVNSPSYLGTQETGTTFSSTLFDSYPKIKELILRNSAKAVLGIGLEGNIHFEAFITVIDGKPVVLPIEANPRMGGKDVWENVLASDGIDVLGQGVLGAFGVRMDPRTDPKPLLTQMRSVIPQFTGKLRAIRGLEALKQAGVYGQWDKENGDKIEDISGPTGNSSDYIGYFMLDGLEEGPTLHKLLAALAQVEIDIETADGVIHTQKGDFGHETNPDDYLVSKLLSEIRRRTQSAPTTPPQRPSAGGLLGRIRDAGTRFPGSYYRYVGLNGLLSFADEGLSVAFAIYGIAQFGLAWGLLAQALYILAKAPGSEMAARLNHGLDSIKIFELTTKVKIGLMLVLPVLAWTLPFGWFLAAFLALQTVRGLVNGASRNMAEPEMLPNLVGQKKSDLEVAGLMSDTFIEGCAMTAAFLYPWMQGRLDHLFGPTLGPGILVAILGALTVPNLLLLKTIKYAQPSASNVVPQKAGALGSGVERLDWRDYVPYVAAHFVHSALYGVLAAVLAKFVFGAPLIAGTMIGSYDAGALLVGLIGGSAALAASAKAGNGERSFVSSLLSPKSWFGLTILATTAFLLSSMAHLPLLSFVSVAALGALILVTKRVWMASYQSRLVQQAHGRMASAVNSIGVMAALLLVFLPIAASSVIAGTADLIRPVLWGISGTTIAGMVAGWFLSRNPPKND